MLPYENQKWRQILSELSPHPSYKYACLSTIIFAIFLILLGLQRVIIDPQNEDGRFVAMFFFSLAIYYLYMSYHRIHHFFWISIWIRLFIAIPIMFSLQMYYLVLLYTCGIISTLIALRYDLYFHNKIQNWNILSEIEENEEGEDFAYELRINIKDENRDILWDFIKDGNNFPLVHPLLKSVEKCIDITSEFADNQDYTYYTFVDELFCCKMKVKYNALLEVKEEEKIMVGYAYDWPDVCVISVYSFQGEEFLQKTFIHAPNCIRSFVAKTARNSHKVMLENSKEICYGSI